MLRKNRIDPDSRARSPPELSSIVGKLRSIGRRISRNERRLSTTER